MTIIRNILAYLVLYSIMFLFFVMYALSGLWVVEFFCATYKKSIVADGFSARRAL